MRETIGKRIQMTTLGFRQEQDIRHPRHGFAGGCVCVGGRGGGCVGGGAYIVTFILGNNMHMVNI